MLAKLLFTLAVVGVLLTLARNRPPPDEAEAAAGLTAWIPWPKLLAFGAVLIVLSAGAGVYYQHWHEANTVVKVRVINSNTGQISVYEAKRKDIGSQRFVTLDRREVTVSDVERIEVLRNLDR